MQITLNFPHEIEKHLQGLPNKEAFIMQATLMALEKQALSEDEEFTPEQWASIERGLADIEAGRTIPHKQMKERFQLLRNKFKTAINQANQ